MSFARIWLALSASIIFLTAAFQVMAQETGGKTGIIAPENEKTIVGQVFAADENSFNGRLVPGRGGGVKFANEVEIGLLEAQSSGVFTFKGDYAQSQADHLTIIDSIDQDPEQKVVIHPQAASLTQADNIP